MAYFVKQEDPEKPGEFIYVEVEADKVELDPDRLKKIIFDSKEYKSVVDESKSRKAKIKELRTSLEQLTSEEAADGENSEEPVKPEKSNAGSTQTAEPLDSEKLYQDFKARLAKEQADAKAEAEAANAKYRALITKHKLGDEAIPLLAQSTNPEEMAALLEKSAFRFDDQIGGAPSQPDKDALLANVLKQKGLD